MVPAGSLTLSVGTWTVRNTSNRANEHLHLLAWRADWIGSVCTHVYVRRPMCLGVVQHKTLRPGCNQNGGGDDDP